MIKFKEQKQTNSYVNNITNEEINLKIHEMLLDLYKGRTTYISDIYNSMQDMVYIKSYSHTLKNIFMINK